jgi:hypothetical protein
VPRPWRGIEIQLDRASNRGLDQFFWGLLSQFMVIWRTERDSNPRTAFTVTHFPGVRLQPLGHLSCQGEGEIHGQGAGGKGRKATKILADSSGLRAPRAVAVDHPEVAQIDRQRQPLAQHQRPSLQMNGIKK